MIKVIKSSGMRCEGSGTYVVGE